MAFADGLIVARDCKLTACADPESFVRGGPTLTRCFFLVDEGREGPSTTISVSLACR